MAKLNDENVLLKTQVEFVVQERENIKLEYQKLFNSIKTTRVQHQWEVNELIENVNQKTYAYGDVRYKNQDRLMTISELKDKLKTAEKGKNVNTKFDKSATLGKLLYVTPLNKNKDVNAKKVSKVKVKSDNSSSVRRPESKDTNLKKRVLLNTKSKSTSTNVKKDQSSVSLVSNKRDTLNSNVSKSNTNVLNAKTVNDVSDGSNIVIQLVLWIVDSGCSKHMNGNLKLLRNFVEKFMGTIRFGMLTSQQSLDM
ncbi:hypothetical protein Tco_0717216 [Tanacetum coccineum]